MEPSKPESTHAVKRADVLAGTLFCLGVGITLLLGPEWGWPFALAGVGGAILYVAMWRFSNPGWLNKALLGILAMFIISSVVVISWRLYAPSPEMHASSKYPKVPTPDEIRNVFERGLEEYQKTHPSRPSTIGNIAVKKEQPIVSVSAPNGIAIGGGMVTNPTVNNYNGRKSIPDLSDDQVADLAGALSVLTSKVVNIALNQPTQDMEHFASHLQRACGLAGVRIDNFTEYMYVSSCPSVPGISFEGDKNMAQEVNSFVVKLSKFGIVAPPVSFCDRGDHSILTFVIRQ